MDDKLLDIKIAGETPLVPVLKKRPKSILEEYKWELERKEIVEKKIRDLKCELTDIPEEKLIFQRGELINQREKVLSFIERLKSQKASLQYSWIDKIFGNKEKKGSY